MKAKGLFVFWVVEHDYCSRWKVLSAKSFKGEKLQAIIVSFDKKFRQLQV